MSYNSGIYQILINNKGYIGSTKDFKRRKREHLSQLSRNKHANFKLQNCFNKYNNITFKVLYYCDIFCLENMENWCIKKFNSELNIKNGARGGFLIGENHKSAKINNKTAIEIINMINRGFSNNEIIEELNLTFEIVSRIRNKKTWRHFSYMLQDINDREQYFIELCKKGYSYNYCILESKLKGDCKKLFDLHTISKNDYIRPKRKYDMTTVDKIREDYRNGFSTYKLSKLYNVSERNVFAIVNNKIYKR